MKKIIYFTALLCIGAYLAVGCSSEEGEGLSTEAQMNIIKQKYNYYANLYGVQNISFDDNLLSKHLNLTDAQIEKSVIQAAFKTGVLDVDASTLRKKFRTRSAEGEEEGGSISYYETDGHVSDSARVENLSFSYTFYYYAQNTGFKLLRPCSATVTKLIKCNDTQCNLWHNDVSSDAEITNLTVDSFNMDWAGGPGEDAVTDIHYYITFRKHNDVFDFNDQTVTKWAYSCTSIISEVINN